MKVGSYFEKYGIGKKDVPKALITFKTISYLSWFGTLALCYKYKPIKSFFKLPYPRMYLNRVITRYPTTYNKCQSFVMDKSKKLGENRFFKKIPESMGLKGKRFSYALAENIVLYKIALPILLPIQFYTTIRIVSNKSIDSVPEIINDSYDFNDNLDKENDESDESDENDNNEE